MKNQIAKIERGKDGSFGIYIENNSLNYGIHGNGKTVEEAKADFIESYAEMKLFFEKKGVFFEECEFVFKYDVASFLEYFNNRITLTGLEAITGVNRKQLGHYLSGHRNPSEKTAKKIEQGLHAFAEELTQVQFS